MRIVHSSFSAAYARIIVQYGTKEDVVVFGPFAPPLHGETQHDDPLVATDIELAISEIAKKTNQPSDDVRQAIVRYLAGVGRFTTPEDWFHRFKAAGGRGRVDVEKIWFSEVGPQPSAAAEVIAELFGPGKEIAYRQVLSYLQDRYRGFVGWADF